MSVRTSLMIMIVDLCRKETITFGRLNYFLEREGRTSQHVSDEGLGDAPECRFCRPHKLAVAWKRPLCRSSRSVADCPVQWPEIPPRTRYRGVQRCARRHPRTADEARASYQPHDHDFKCDQICSDFAGMRSVGGESQCGIGCQGSRVLWKAQLGDTL